MIYIGVKKIQALFCVEERLSETQQKIIYLITLVCFIALATLISSNYSRDSIGYHHRFDIYGSSGWTAFFIEMHHMEAFFLIVSKILYQAGLSPVYLFLIYATISLTIKFYLIDRFSQNKWLSLTFFSSYFFILHDSTQIRFSLAVAFVYLGLHFLAEGKKLLFSAMVIFSAIMFHVASVIFIIMLLFTTKKSLLWLLGLLFFAVLLYPMNLHGVLLELTGNVINYFNVHGSFLNKLYGYMLKPSSNVHLGMATPVTLLVYFCAVIIYQYRTEFNQYETLCYNAFILSIFFYILMKDIVDLQVRMGDLFGFSLVFLVPYVHRGLAEVVGKKYAYIILYSFFLIHLFKYTLYDKMLIF